MPPTDEPTQDKSLKDVVRELDLYPIEAFRFVQEGLSHIVREMHVQPTGSSAGGAAGASGGGTEVARHITGQQLCEGLRQYALVQWGLLARTVLQRWNITCTLDFGRIVFALVEAGHMQKTDEDTIEDFRNVYDFRTAFERGYRIEHKP